MDKITLLEQIRTARAHWDKQISAIPSEDYEQAGLVGGWSLKDVIAHMSWYEREISRMLLTRSYINASQWWALPDDERNQHIYAANQDRKLADVLLEAQTSYQDLITAIATVTDSDLVDPSQFVEHPPGALPWEIIAQNSYEHYEQHVRDVEAWLVRV